MEVFNDDDMDSEIRHYGNCIYINENKAIISFS